MSKRSDEKVHVAVRCRPMTESERTSRVRRAVECNSKSREVNVMTSSNGLGLGTSQQTKAYSFDKVFGPNATQLDVYNGVVSGQLNDVLSGYNCTVLAYGQTGTGKTFTMEGERTLNREFSWDTDPRAGIIPRALSQLFDQLESSGCEFSVRVSLLEIYNEEIYDLLSPGNGMLKMKIYEDHNRKGSVVVSGLTEVLIRDKSDVYAILQQGAAKRRTAATDLNEFSSRSHSVFSVTVHTKDISTNQMEEEELIKIGKLNLVDLAGSENIGRSGAVDKRAREAGSINTSLLTLGRCITALVDRAPHVPYRESKLTRLLQDSLGGATKTSIIATISPGNDNLDETLSTLDYASRAKNIHNRPRVNQKLTKRALIKEYDEEIQRLQREVLAAREKNGVYLDPKQYQEMTEKIESLTATLQQRKEDLDKYQKLFTDASNELEEKIEQLSTLKDDLEQTQLKLSEQCFIKEAHIEHGNQLTERATELLETANVLSDDITKVHDKVDRVKDANEHNLDAANAFTNKIKGDVKLLCDGTNVILQESENNLQHMLTGLEDLKERQDGNVLCIKTQIMQFRDTMKDALQTNCSKMQQAMDNMSDLNETQQSIFDDHKTEMNSIMTSSVLELEKKCETITSNLLSLIQSLQTSFDFQRDQMRKEAERMKDHQEAIRSEAAEIEARNNEVLKAGKNNLDDMVEKVNQQMRESIAAALSSLVDGNTRNCQSLSKLKQSADDVNEATVTSTNERITQLDQVQEQAVSILQESANSSEAVLLQQKNCQEQLRQDMEKFASDAQSNYDTTIKEWSSSIESSTENVKTLSDASVSLETKCSEELSLFDEFAVSRLESIVEAAGEVSSNISVAKESFQGASESVGTEVDEYYREKLVRVLPTGETPARKQYSYSHRIPERPEEEDVLLKFQEQMQLAELEEDADEEDVVACDDEASDESQDTEASSDQKMPGAGEADLDQSITIPSIGGRPFFTNRKGGKSRGQKLHANNNTKAKCATRLPLRATHNTGF